MAAIHPDVVPVFAVAALGTNLAFVLRPARSKIPTPIQLGPVTGTYGNGIRAWARRNYSTLLSVGRGALNGSVVALGLRHASHPLMASMAEGLTAGALSGSLQIAFMNERFSAYLNRASSEAHRLIKWLWFQALFYGLVKAAGTLLGSGPRSTTGLLLAYVATITFGVAQYPWAAAIACRRGLRSAQGLRRSRVRFIADLQTMAVSVTCVGASVLNSVGVPYTRVFLVVVGLTGLGYYRSVKAAARRCQTACAGRTPRKTPARA